MSEIDEIVHRDNIFTSCGYYGSLLHVAAAEGRVEIVKLLIKKGLPVDNLNEFGLSPVYYAATNGKLATLKYLVENHCVDIHIENIFGKTMLDMALEKNHNDTVQYLQEINVKTGSQQGSLSFLEDGEFRARAFSMLCKSILPI
jgi:ankyrin repeat protein